MVGQDHIYVHVEIMCVNISFIVPKYLQVACITWFTTDFEAQCADETTGYTDRLIYIPRHIKIRPLATLEKRTQESELITGKLVDDLDVAASPCHVEDSRYSSIQSLS